MHQLTGGAEADNGRMQGEHRKDSERRSRKDKERRGQEQEQDQKGYIGIYPSHGYTALVANKICKKYQAILACGSSLGTYRCM